MISRHYAQRARSCSRVRSRKAAHLLSLRAGSCESSNWQKSIEGEWHGVPAIFDHDGQHEGFNKVYRQSAFSEGKTLYTMHTVLEGSGALRARLEFSDFAFGVIDSDQDRIYLGPDFIGSGQPYGALVDSIYYSPAWTSELRTMVHIVPAGELPWCDGPLQVYSSLLHEGPAINAVFNGLYQVAHDYHTNQATQARIESFIASERVNGPQPHILDAKLAGHWTGEMQVYDAQQQLVGTNQVRITHTPLTLLRAAQTVEISGVVNRRYTFNRYRNNNRHTYEGPDLYGNSIGYGRALYTTQHLWGEALKIRGREFMLDDQYTMSVVWEFLKSNRVQYVTFGLLRWEATGAAIEPNFGGR